VEEEATPATPLPTARAMFTPIETAALWRAESRSCFDLFDVISEYKLLKKFRRTSSILQPGTRNLKLKIILYLIFFKISLQKVLTVHNVWCT
jgi:hypothetical protein